MFFHGGLKPNEICHNLNEPNASARFYCIITAKGRAPRVVYGASMDDCAAAVKKKRDELGIVKVTSMLSKVERSKMRTKLAYYEQFRGSVVAYVARELCEPTMWIEGEGFMGEKVMENSEAGVLYWAAGLGDRREPVPHVQKKPRADAVGVVLELMLALYGTQRKAQAYIGRRIDLAAFYDKRPDWSEQVVLPSEPWDGEEEDD